MLAAPGKEVRKKAAAPVARQAGSAINREPARNPLWPTLALAMGTTAAAGHSTSAAAAGTRRSPPAHGRRIQFKCARCGGADPTCAECGSENEKFVRRKPNEGNTNVGQPQPPVNPVPTGGGQPLDGASRAYFGARFNRDFGDVRVHTGASAEKLTKSYGALAYTTGRDIVFADGRYSPASKDGKRLLAHELTHVVQQSGSGQVHHMPQPARAVGMPNDPLEREADSIAERIATGLPVETGIASAAPAIQRQNDDHSSFLGDLVGQAEAVADQATQQAAEAGGALATAAGAVVQLSDDAIDWLASLPGRLALAAARNLVGRFGGTIIIRDGSIIVTVPEITIFERLSYARSWMTASQNVPLLQRMVDIPYIGPTFFELYGRGEAATSLGASIGPGALRNVTFFLKPGTDLYYASSEFYVPAALTAGLQLTGILGIVANWLCLVDVITVEGSLAGAGTGSVGAALTGFASLTYDNRDVSIEGRASMQDASLELGLALGAGVQVLLLGHSIWGATWNLTGGSWTKPLLATGSLSADVVGGSAAPDISITPAAFADLPSMLAKVVPAIISDPFNAKPEEKKKIKCKRQELEPCEEALPILWPDELPPLGEIRGEALKRAGTGEWDRQDRDPEQRKLRRQIDEETAAGVDISRPCFATETSPLDRYHAHHIQPLFLNGGGSPDNLCALRIDRHQPGHNLLNAQPEKRLTDPAWERCGLTDAPLTRHATGQTYYVDNE